MSYSTILLETRDGVATLTLNRPEMLNSLNKAIVDDIRSALRALARDDATKVLVVTGAGRGFCAGADLTTTGGNDGSDRSVGEGVAYAME
ncbi:MAG: enoyl-CoA hydratase/isomerase family protein, partial [Alphaproteobacteria bacterium]